MKLLKVAKWEFLKNFKSKQFLVMTFVIPLLMGVVGGLPILIALWTVDRVQEIAVAVIDETDEIYPELARKLAGRPLRLVKADEDHAALLVQLEAGEFDGLLVIGGDIGQTNAVSFYLRGRGGFEFGELGGFGFGELAQALTAAIADQRLARAGYDPAKIGQLTEAVRIHSVPVGPAGRGPAAIAVPVALTMLLMFGSMVSGAMLLYEVIKEKTSRVVELLFSSISANDLMMGKILGYGATSLIQITIWGGIAYAIANHYFGISLADLSGMQLVAYPLYFVLGYLLVATLYATQGSVMKDVQSGSQLHGLVAALPIVPLMLTEVIIAQPDLGWVRAFSFFPPFTPATMMLRLAVGQVPWWEVLASLALLALFIYLLMRFAAKVFEIGLLMYGKSATFQEIWRWGVQSFRRG